MIRWLTPEIGTASYASCPADTDAEIVDVRGMVDREGNNAEVIRGHISRALAALTAGRRVVLCCDHGISRSNAIAIAIIAQHRQRDFDDVLRDVLTAAGNPEIRVEVLAAVRAALSMPHQPPRTGHTRILITGAGGGLGNLMAANAPPGVEVLLPARDELDLLHGPAPVDLYLRRHAVTRIMHFAHPRVVNTNAALGQALTMLRNLLDACVVNDIGVLYPSSWHVFAGHRANELNASEATALVPATCLGDTKFLCETLLAQYVERHGLTATVLRSGVVVGNGAAPHFLRALSRRASQGDRLVTHQYDNGYPALDVLAGSDYAEAAWGLLQDGGTGTFHAGSGELLSTYRIAQLVVAALGSDSPVEVDVIKGHSCKVRIDSGKLSMRLGWRPKVSPELAISHYATYHAAGAEVSRGPQ